MSTAEVALKTPQTIVPPASGLRSRGLHTLYISPLKALAVDIARNLERPIGEMGLSSLLYEFELSGPKAGSDVVLNGHAYAPAGKSVTETKVRLKLHTIDKTLNGEDLLGSTIWIEDRKLDPGPIRTSPRVGIDYAGEYKDKPSDKESLYKYFFYEGSEAIMNMPDGLKERNIGMALYSKPGYALGLLRDQIIGAERFDYAFKNYIKRWAYKHPTPWDFFRTIENVAVEDSGRRCPSSRIPSDGIEPYVLVVAERAQIERETGVRYDADRCVRRQIERKVTAAGHKFSAGTVANEYPATLRVDSNDANLQSQRPR